MTATSLAGRSALDDLRLRHGEYEAALALGFLPRDAMLEVCRPTVGQALMPPLVGVPAAAAASAAADLDPARPRRWRQGRRTAGPSASGRGTAQARPGPT